MAIDKYILMPWDYLSCDWFKGLGARQMVVFLAMKGLSRMDKSTPRNQVRVSLKVLGKEMSMSTTTVKRAVDDLVRLQVVKVVAKGEGREPSIYELAEPIELVCRSVPGSRGNAVHKDDLYTANTNECGTQTAEGHHLEHNEAVAFQVHEEMRNTIFTPHRGESTKDSPHYGTEEADSVPGPNVPRCPKCRSVMDRTNTFMPATELRIWKCRVCFEEVAVRDEDLVEPIYTAPRPAKPLVGGQDRAISHDF